MPTIKYKLDLYNSTYSVIARYQLEGELGLFTAGCRMEVYDKGIIARCGVWAVDYAEKFFKPDIDNIFVGTGDGFVQLGPPMIAMVNNNFQPIKCWCGTASYGGGGIHLDYCHPDLIGKVCLPL